MSPVQYRGSSQADGTGGRIVIRRYLLDTGIAQDFQDDRGDVRARAKAARKLGHSVGICVPVLGELWSGVEASASRDRNLKTLRWAISRLTLWPYTADAAAESAHLRRAKTGRSPHPASRYADWGHRLHASALHRRVEGF